MTGHPSGHEQELSNKHKTLATAMKVALAPGYLQESRGLQPWQAGGLSSWGRCIGMAGNRIRG
ncbi:MAG: hypothetical protein JW971_00060, partial [Synergistales bacterium]|nr:hypothetical protein [Synergistales bacterium]